MVDTHFTPDLLNKVSARHHITIAKTWQRGQGDWCIQLFRENHPHPDGSGEYVTCRHHDLKEMCQDLVQYLTHVEEIDMNIFGTNLFKYMAGEMLLDKKGKPVVVKMTVKDVRMENISNAKTTDEKPMVSFEERDKWLVLNKTNARAIATQYGGETDDWKGQRIALTAEHGAWFGKKGVRVVVLDHLPENGNGKVKPPPVIEDDIPWIEETS